MILALLPGAALADLDSVCAQGEDASFDDVASDGTFGAFVECIAGFGIVQGDADGNFNPTASVTRGQAAIFIANFIETAQGDVALPEVDPNPFTDVSDGAAASSILKLVEAGVVNGVTDTTFAPGDSLTRGQMAAIVVAALEFLGVNDLDATAGDFTDVAADGIFADAINKLANAGIIDGLTETTYGASADVTRGQLAKFVANGAVDADDAGLFNPPAAVASNEFFNVTPGLTAVTITGDADDDTVFTVDNAVVGAVHQIALVDAADITVEDSGAYSFASTANEADLGDAAVGTITVVNGAPIAAATTATITPTSSEFTFRVDVDADETFWILVYFDADESGSLTTDADDLPVDTEPFGIGGPINADPAEAADGSDAGPTAITAVDTDAQFIIAGDTFFYDDNDSLLVDGEQATFASFVANLQVGDDLTVTDYQSEDALESTFEITNVVPAAPTGLTTVAGQQDITITFDNIVDDATVTVYYDVDGTLGNVAVPALDTDAFDSASFTADGDEDTADYQVTITGLTAGEDYQFYAVQEDASGESASSAGFEEATDGDISPTADSVIANDINDGVGTTNSVLVTFSEAVTIDDATGFTFTIGGFTINGVSAVADNDAGDRWAITLDQTLNDAGTDVTYTGDVAAESFSDSTGNDNVLEDGYNTFDY
jgi:hypothetical protein